MDALLGIVILFVGGALGVAGLRLHTFLLPVGGLVSGFVAGAGAIAALLGDGFLGSTLGVIAGVALGLLAAALSHLFWYVGVVLTAGLAGGVLGAGIAAAFGVEGEGFLLLIGLVAAGAAMVATVVFDAPEYFVIGETALTGAILVVVGLLLMLDAIDREEFGTGALWRELEQHWLLWVLGVVLVAAGVIAQLLQGAEHELPEERWTRDDLRPAM